MYCLRNAFMEAGIQSQLGPLVYQDEIIEFCDEHNLKLHGRDGPWKTRVQHGMPYIVIYDVREEEDFVHTHAVYTKSVLDLFDEKAARFLIEL